MDLRRRALYGTAILSLCAGSAFGEIVLVETPGVEFQHRNGARGDRWLPETMGAGVAILDANEDGHLDLAFADGRLWEDDGNDSSVQLFLGDGDFGFRRASGRGLPQGIYGMGVVCADFDGDGHADLATTALEGVFISYGLGDANFEEPRKLIDGWCSSISVADFDSDGQLDLFVGRYVQWSAEQDIWCTLDGALKSYCTPELYEASSCVLLMGTGDRRFSDRSRAMRVDLPAKTLGSVALDVDADGDVDILVANDTMPDFFLRNEGDHFDEVGIEMGMALSTTGMSRAGMGIDALFLEEFELPAFVVAHFSGEATGLFVQHGESGFFDEANRRGVGAATRPLLSFGLLSVDLDLDGQLDLVSANGHIESEIARWRPGHSFRQPLSVLRNDGGNFVPAELSIALPQLIGRGLASADLDGDGDADLVVCQNGDTPLILRNDSTWQRVLIVEAAAAASVEVVLESGRTLRRARVVGNSYLSSSESALRFGLLATDRPHSVLVNGEQLEPASWAVQEMTQ